MAKSYKGTVYVDFMERELEVDFSYYYAPAVMYLSNGDPGYPDESELEIFQVYKEGKNYLPVLERYDKLYPKMYIFNDFEDVVWEEASNYEGDYYYE